MAEDLTKKYLNLVGLQKYDELIKQYIATADTAILNQILGEVGNDDPKTIAALNEAIKALQGTDHTHINKELLDGITDLMVSGWETAATNSHTHANKDLLDTYTQTEADLADAVSKKHSHENAEVLGGIDADKVAAWDAAQTNVIEAISVNGVDATIAGKKASVTIPEATTSASGVMSAADKTKLDGLANIKSVGDNLAVDTDGKLTVTIPEATVTGVDETEVDGLKLQLTDKKVTLVDAGLANTLTSKDITLETAETATEGYLKTYVLKQGTTEIGKIDLPKELVVTGGEVIVASDEAGLTEGEKYLKLTIANQDSPVYIAVKDLVDVYTEGNGIEISDANVVSVKIAENTSKDAVTLSADANGLSATLTGWDDLKTKVYTLGISNIDGLQDALNGKADEEHTHVIADITDFDTITEADILALFPGQSAL